MFQNPFRKSTTPAAATGDTPAVEGQGATGLSAEALQAWRERIAAAGSDDATLLQLAGEAPAVELKLAAIGSLTQEESFRRAMQEFRERDKRLYRAARSRWEAARARRAALAAADALMGRARALLDEGSLPANRVVELDRAWAGLNSEWLAPETRAAFEVLRERLGARLRAQGEGEQALLRWLATVDEACARLRASLPGVAQGVVPADETEGPAAALQEALGSAPVTDDARRVGKEEKANRVLALASSVVERAKFLQALPTPGSADESGEKRGIEQWRAFPEVSDEDLRTTLAHRFADWRNANARERQAARNAQRAEERERIVRRSEEEEKALERALEAGEAALAAGQVAELTHHLARIDRALKRAPASAGFRSRVDALRREHLRLRHWQRWGGAQRREELAAEARELAQAAAGKVLIKEHAEAIMKLRERWKELDRLGGASKHAVWLEFDGALKAAYAPVAAHREKLKAARAENLAARDRIIEGLVRVAAKHFPARAADDSGTAAALASPDWRAIARTLEEARIAWRKLGPVEHTVPRNALQGENAVAARYAAAVKALEAPLEMSFDEARREREQLISRAKEISGPDGVMRDVVDKVRGLQAQWQTLARAMPLPRREEDAFWNRFKAATNAIFTARDAARAAKDAESVARARVREAIIERLAAVSTADSAQEIRRVIAQAASDWRAAPEAPRPQAGKLDARYRAAREAVAKRLGELAAEAARARYDALLAKLALCEEREALLRAGRVTTEEDSAELRARWEAVENLPDNWNARIEVRFRAGADTAPAAHLPDLLLNLEAALGIDSPAEFQPARQRLKLLALKAAIEGRQASVTSATEIERWLLEAAATPRPDEPSRERLNKIIVAMRQRAK